WWIVTILACVALALVAYYRDTIVEKFEPHKESIVNFPVSWLYPVLILIILSFPPLGGHEIVLLVVGLIWGVWIGFAIACAGTFIGEMLCFFLFKYLLTKKAQEVENKNIFYACVARLQREGGIVIIAVVRFSVIPGHVVTAIQSTSGMSWFKYSIAVIISLPKQLAVVWLGDLFGQTGSGTAATEHRIISLTVFFVTALMSVLALYSVYMRARRYYPELQREADLRRSKDGTDSERDEGHPSNLAEAAMEGEPGPGLVHGGRGGAGGGYGGFDTSTMPYGQPYGRDRLGAADSTTRIPMVRTHTGGTWTETIDSKSQLDLRTAPDRRGGPFDDPSMSSVTIPLEGGTNYSSGTIPTAADRWSEVEERERRQAADPGSIARAYDPNETSYGHLPLASASEVETQGGAQGHAAEQIPYVPQQRAQGDNVAYESSYGAVASTR
ncbi:hypothetical protein JCM10212_006828, partial [Sporobolomyces blumeae]